MRQPVLEPYAHRLADVEQQPADEVRLLLVLLEVEAAGPAVDLPVDVLDVVAGDVLAVLGELDGEAVVRALVHARQVALDDQPRLQLQAADLGERQRVEVALRVVSIGSRRGMIVQSAFTWRARRKRKRVARRRPCPCQRSSFGSRGIMSASRRTMSSGLMPSASALKLVMMRCRSTGTATARMSSHET